MPDINRAYSWAIETCNAPNVGYSQAYRNQQVINGITYYDCSSFINYALLAGGFETPSYAPEHNAFTTYTEPTELLRLGFVEVDSKGEYLSGDIGLSSGHTEMCYKGGNGGGYFMGAHTDNAPLQNQVSIDDNYFTSFPRLFRYGDGGAIGYGSSIWVVSALCGNSWRESGINSGRHQVDGTAFGMFQWDGSRRDNLLTWLSQNGYEKNDPYGQMKYLIIEDDWIGEFAGISSLTDFLTSGSTSIPQLTEAFMTCWERPGIPELQQRIEFAYKCFNFIQIHAQDKNIKEWCISPDALTEPQTLNNAVLLYRFFSAGGGGGGTPTHSKSKMPVWLYIRYKY